MSKHGMRVFFARRFHRFCRPGSHRTRLYHIALPRSLLLRAFWAAAFHSAALWAAAFGAAATSTKTVSRHGIRYGQMPCCALIIANYHKKYASFQLLEREGVMST